MEAHKVLKEAGFNVSSFGTGSAVRLPGPSIDRPNIYEFGTPYDSIYNDLAEKDAKLYQANGLLPMLDRNRSIKTAPQRWQDHNMAFDIVFTCEERCFDAVCEDLVNRGEQLNLPVHIINVEIKDNPEEAAVGAQGILDLAKSIATTSNLDESIISVLNEFEKKHPRLPVLHAVSFF
ncbi:hypothetical protein CANCADRAFT_32511 [Tortispora caseinolytica NRRL Y-17796]|uniref:RNA polymerase II subunit A C-terminal domain phosphatase SSU72 n=1 Tax=Tortispora caseinolytica NRRL Y-17796 TaxID=767744 RepID=A0A1E4TBQ6_9ASCO|nr:hypothetical protein CANCADRAFT_32511 [Tortispora caseinolytica NRRL Y-17796]